MSGYTPSRAESSGHLGESGRLPALGAFLDADPKPSFIVPINEISPTSFDLIFCNEAFLREGLKEDLLREADGASKFQAWAQVVAHWRGEYEFAGKQWTAFKIQNQWKCVQASVAGPTTGTKMQNCQDLSSETIKKALQNAKIADVRLANLYSMMEMSAVGTFEYSPQGTLLQANESWYRLSLHPGDSEKCSDFSFMDLVYPPDASMVLSQWNRLIQGEPVTFEMRWKGENYQSSTDDSDGVDDYQWVLSACLPIIDEEGNIVSIAGNTIDINAQKQAHNETLHRAEALERARASERRFARFALLAPIGIYICDPQGQMVYCNNRFFEMTGQKAAEDDKNLDMDAIVFPEDRHILERLSHRLMHDKQRTHEYFRLNHTWDLGDGTLRQAWIEVQVFPEVDDAGEVVAIFGAMTDISRFKWAEEIQKSRMEEALDAKHKHENFIDMTSHEMRNPLSAVIQCADSTIDSLKLIRSQKTKWSVQDTVAKQIDDELRTCLDSLNTIISCSIHQKRVIDDVLTLSKMDSNLLAIAPVRVEPATIVAEAVHMFELECNKDKISISFSKSSSLQALGAHHVMMDSSRVLQVLINLLTNAIKFTRDRASRRIEVSLGACSSRPSDGFHGIPYASVTTEANGLLNSEEWGLGQEIYVWIQCRDTGCGMTKAEQANLFTRFSQATPRTHIRYGGSGLGLFISKKLTELQGGAIGVHSEPDVGSTFLFFVPTRVAPPPTPTPKSDSLRVSPLIRTLSEEATVTLKGALEKAPQYTVLIVEDNLVNQNVLSQQLRKAGCRVHVANHGEEALQFLCKTQYWASNTTNGSPESQTEPPIQLSLILMDIEMPVMDGLTCTRRIREFQESGHITGHVPIMAVSANARSEQVQQSREAGMDDAISKPFRIPELMPKIKALVDVRGPVLVLTSNTLLV